MRERKRVILSLLFATLLQTSHGCQIEGVTLWALPIQTRILDTHVGLVLSRSTSNIEDITDVTSGQATIAGPYFDVSLVDSQLVIVTNDAYTRYEEIELSSRVSLTLDFRCSGGDTNSIVVWIDITDTNNNRPEFIPTNEFEFVVAPPLPPGFSVTGCLSDITARDIDLTTSRIDFTIEDNPHFEIEYDEESSTVAKEFKAHLRTKTFIRSLSEPVTLMITATDVDETGDPPLSTTALVRILPDTEFQFPEEPVFSQTFYLANYTEDHQLNLLETISLQQGFDEYVNFTLEGAHHAHFALITNGNQVSIEVTNPLLDDIWLERQILLIVRAERDFTSGDTTTIIVELPKEISLQFEKVYYEGAIINNSLELSPLVLSQGYEARPVSVEIVGELSAYFTASVQGELVTLTMTALSDDIIGQNSFISVQVVARNDRSETTAVVNLEIIKDDNVTPVFDKPIYSGTYNSASGLNADPINFVQGYDETVTITLIGEYAHYFQINQNGVIITLTSSTIPPELYSLQNILISIQASKPRTVGANAAIHIALPAARELNFEESTYTGSIQGNDLVLPSILLSNGYEEGVNFDVSGEYAAYFTATSTQDRVNIELSRPLPDSAITQNSVIVLTLTASGVNAVTTSATILLEVIKDDTTTPTFSRNIYYGTYSGVAVEVDEISLQQGFDTDVLFRLDGANSEFFRVSNNGNNVAITLQSPIPEDLIFREKVLAFNVIADKALTVGANAAVLIRFPSELTDSAIMRFSKNTYIGTLEENEINLENIVLDIGFAIGTEFFITGDYAEHFSLSDTNNIVQVSNLSTLPSHVVEENEFIVLEIEARRERAVSVWTSVVIDIVKEKVIAPVFDQAYYTGFYTEQTGLTFEETINLKEGYGDNVTFGLSGESATWFLLDQQGSSLSLMLGTPVPKDVLDNSNQLLFTIVATKPNDISGRAVISIDLPKDFTASSFRFRQDFYEGTVEDGNIALGEIVLGDYTNDVIYTFSGDYAENFQLTNQNGHFTLEVHAELPTEVLLRTNVFVFTLEAQNVNIRTHTVIILENNRTNEVQRLEFEEPYYIGAYSESELLQFDSIIRLTAELEESVGFELEGENSEWFGLVRNGNSVTVTLTNTIPAAVLANNQQLVFVITAQRPGSATARATVIIALIDEFPVGYEVLGFDQVTYIGSIENNQTTIPDITLSEGFTQDVVFTLHGELSDYFSLSTQEAVVTVALRGVIPEQSIPANRIIILVLQASAPKAMPAHATIVFEVVDDIATTVVELLFAQTFYNGSYNSATGLSFPTPLSLTQGYDPNVEFDLEGDNAQWFGLVRNGNSVTVTLTNTIPAAVLANNQQLVFVVTALRPGSATARATVVIALIDEFPVGSDVLGFDQVTYLGSIENNQVSLPELTLSEGFTQDVVFTLHGELSEYFSLSTQGSVVTVALQGAIPEQSIPANRIIILVLQASAPEAMPAHATIVFEVVDDIATIVVELLFAQTFYNGSYNSATGLSFPTPLSLTQGYDPNVEFDLEGDNAQWFGLVRNGNSVTVTLTNTIPAAVLANNQQLVFVVTAQRPGSATARATVVIALIDEFPVGSDVLGFDQVTYLGSIENNQVSLPELTLSEGFTQDVVFTLHGELSEYFSLSTQGAVVTVALQGAIPEQSIPANRIIILVLQASAPEAMPAHATIVFEVVDDIATIVVELLFAQTFYNGSYNSATGLSFPTSLSLTQGYDPNVEFDLEGDNAQWFGLVRNGNSVTVTLTNTIPAAVLANNQQLVFVVTAQRPGSATARATVVIALIDEFPVGSDVLGFDQVTYLGSIENNQVSLPELTLSEGFTQDVVFTLHGELSEYFSLSTQGAVVTVALREVIPEQSIPANRIIILVLQASAPEAMPAHATIVFEVVDDIATIVVELLFAQTFYNGSYNSATGLSFPTPLSLTQGYDPNVEFDLEGDNAQWFGLVRNGNSVTVTLTNTIPAAVLANNQQLVFVVTAQRPGSATARATVVIALIDEFPVGSDVLGFDQVTYLGSIENNQVSLPELTLSEGFTQDVVFTLHGELSEYFSLSTQGAVVTVALRGAIPEQSIPANRIIILVLQASAPEAMPAHATIVFEVVDDIATIVVELLFAQTFYNGSYNSATGLSFPTPLSLTQGYDPNVEFDLEGDNAQWFGLVRNGNSVTVTLTNTIPAAVLANNQQLVFVVTAQRPGSATARATVVIALIDEFPVGSDVLGFDQVTYLGSIENNQVSLPELTLSEGFTQDVVFTLHGELSEYFSLSTQGAVVTVALREVIPEQSIPANRIIILVLQASAPEAMPAHATIVFEVVDDIATTVVELLFAQTFYNGSYNSATGLSFPTPLSLTQGYDPNVEFDLEGDNAQWFGLVRNGNSVTVTLTNTIPAAVLANNQQLVFVVTAQRPGSATARATVVIALIDEFPVGSDVLGFDQVTYLGSIENNQVSLPELTLSEGFTQDVVFTLHGELSEYFSLSTQGAVVTVALRGAIPEQSIPANRIIILVLQASAPEAMPAHATIVFEVVDDIATIVVELLFAQTFYNGSYNSATGLSFPTPLSLTQGYDPNVEFDLEGDNAQWFGLVRNGNSVTVTLTNTIPAAVLANNQQLVFVVTAQRPGSATARATVVIALIDEFPVGSDVLGFDQVTYLGSIENNQVSLPELTLSEGFTQDVVFTLHGELSEYFSLSTQGAVVTVALRGAIPEQSIPANRIIILVLQASAPEAMPAHATIVFEVVDDIATIVVELLFAQTFYNGSYNSATGLSFPTPLSLTQGYDPNVEFDLEGDNAQWFGLVRNGNSVTVTLTNTIPAAVLANNQQLVFVVTAQRPGSATARATVVIALIDEFPVGSDVLGFDQVTYLGSIENNQVSLPELTLSEGFTQDVVFTLHGELSEYFSLSTQGAVVSVALRGAIPEQSIPANRIIILVLQASAPEAMPAHATIVFEVVDDIATTVVELLFAQTFYNGSYNSATGLSFPTPLSLTQGYDPNVEFDLEGDNAQWFGLVRNGNSVTVTLTNTIPAAVLANNQQLVFVVTAQRPGSATARATVVIALIDEFPVGSDVLGFDQVTYLGSIENNQVSLPELTLSEGFTQDVVFTLHGELSEYFSLSTQGAVVTVALREVIPEQSIPANRIIILVLKASAPEAMPAHATIVLEVVDDIATTVVELLFAQTFYNGSYNSATGLSFPTPLSLTQGYDPNVEFDLEGENAQWFGLVRNGNSVTVTLTNTIPAAVLANNQQLVFVVTARKPGSATARATVVIALVDDSQAGSDVTFEKVIYEGVIRNGLVSHEVIIITGFSGSTVEVLGHYSSLFTATLESGEVTVNSTSSLTLPTDTSHVALEIRAGSASAVLLLDVIQTDTPTSPVVTFSSPSYAVRTDITHTGLVGQVQASADNGEALTYSLQLNNAHLQERLSIKDDGELHLSAPVNSGSYTFSVAATTIFTQTRGTATVHLSVEAITVCGDELVMPPLIVLNFDEEEPHYDLIDGTRYDNCNFTLSNRWPLDQTWVYVDKDGLHTLAIDREHESIAFMPVSQVQVEVILHCEEDSTRTKRSLTSDPLDPYDYGNNKWILTDTILYNSRRSFVNLIVNDINDNYPIFVGKEYEPITVGYPVPELAERVLPRSLAELQATDADIGENAALRYWSAAPELAVSPTTGFVHLRDGATLENGIRLTIHATDRNGEGNVGSIDILVRLLDERYIAVVTIRNAFLDDEKTVVSYLTEAVGYEVKVLRSVVISDEVETENDELKSRKNDADTSSTGASLQLYVYGLIAREPVSVDRLTTDISNTVIAPVTVASSVSLQDYLDAQEICVIAERGVGLLVATIVLSVLLFIILVLIAVWYFLRWRKNRNYDEFTDANSLASRDESVDKFPRPEFLPKPRLDIGELKKSERRLQEMLDAPIQEISVEPTSSRNDAILDMPTPEPITPIVIQSIDKLKDAADSSEDEFGETRSPKRKSVVTFNENVEKIIHVEDIPDIDDVSTDPDYEIYKL